MKISAVKVDSARIERGVWVGNIPEMGDVELLVRGWNNVAFRRMQQELIRALPRAQRRGPALDPAVQDRITARCLAETVLYGWRNVEDDDGKPIAYSKELALEWLLDPDMRAFFDAVTWAAMSVADETHEDREEMQKNSLPSSDAS